MVGMNFNVKLNIKAITIAEKMLGKPFSEINLFADEDAEVLLYAMVLANNDEVLTIGGFRKLIKNSKRKKKLLKEVDAVLSVVKQFDDRPLNPPQGDLPDGGNEKVFVSEIAALLIVRGGVSAHYVMYEMDLYEMNALMKSIEEEKRQGMEEKRLWTYLSILPHIDGKKIKSVSDFYPFPWEVEAKESDAKKDIELHAGRFEAFLNSKKEQCQSTD